MKKLLLLLLLAMLVSTSLQAQSLDSTSLPSINLIASTFEPAVPSGTVCGSVAYDMRFVSNPQNAAINGYVGGVIQSLTLCQGHNPLFSCPYNFSQRPAGESGQGMFFFICQKN